MHDTQFDKAVDEKSINPGFQMFEKRVSGMFLGEVLRQVLLTLVKDADLFNGKTSTPLNTQYGIDTAAMSTIAGDDSTHLDKVGDTITAAFGIADSRTTVAQKPLSLGV